MAYVPSYIGKDRYFTDFHYFSMLDLSNVFVGSPAGSSRSTSSVGSGRSGRSGRR